MDIIRRALLLPPECYRAHTQLVFGRADSTVKGEGSVGCDRADETRGQCVLQTQAAVEFVNVSDQLCAVGKGAGYNARFERRRCELAQLVREREQVLRTS